MTTQYEDDEEYHFDDSDDFDFEEDDFAEFEEQEPPIEKPEQPQQQSGVASSSGSEAKVTSPIEDILNKMTAPENRKPLLIAGGSIVAVFIFVYVMMGAGSSTTPQRQVARPRRAAIAQTAAPAATATASIPQSAPNVQSQPLPLSTEISQPQTLPIAQQSAALLDAPPLQAPVAEQFIQQTTKDIAGLQQQAKLLQTQVGQISDSGTHLSQRIDNIEQSIQHIETQISYVNHSLQTMAKMVKNVQMSRPTSMASSEQRQTDKKATGNTSRHTFFVQAIIPGRAWLKDSDDRTITVATGDYIAGLGKVVSINPQEGTVRTSAGVTIDYGIEQQ